jgi:hypothetical protein
MNEVAVMVAVPLAYAVTLPFESTVATEVLLDDQEMLSEVAGLKVAVRVAVPEG